jgi:hypothetical protein
MKSSRYAPAALAVMAAMAAMAGLTACAPTARPLGGVPTPERALPEIALAAGHRHIAFRWDYEENSLIVHGEGAARLAAPDSARVDLFLNGGVAVGRAVLVGNTITATNQSRVERVLPPPPMMWAAFGRLAIPALPDTVVTVEGDVLRADIGRPATWRVTIRGSRLMQLARLSGGRIVETVTRDEGGRLLYEVPGRRKLWLGIIRDEEVPAFDASIWRP